MEHIESLSIMQLTQFVCQALMLQVLFAFLCLPLRLQFIFGVWRCVHSGNVQNFNRPFANSTVTPYSFNLAFFEALYPLTGW